MAVLGRAGSSPVLGTNDKELNYSSLSPQQAVELAIVGNNWGIMEQIPFGKPRIVDHGGDLSKQWHVYYRYWDKDKKKLVKARKSKIKNHLYPNRSSDPQERYYQLRIIRNALEKLLSLGWNPKDDFPTSKLEQESHISTTQYTIETAINETLRIKKGEIKARSHYALERNLLHFLSFLKDKSLHDKSPNQINRKIILEYLRVILETKGKGGGKASNKTRNNYLGDLSSIFEKMVEEEMISRNPCKGIPKLKEQSSRHTPFSANEIKMLGDWMDKHNPYLKKYTHFVTYAFLRPNEIIHLKVRDIDLTEGVIYLQKENSKVGAAKIPIVEKLKDVLNEMLSGSENPDHYLFTQQGTPGRKKVRRSDFFSEQFIKAKEFLTKQGKLMTANHTLYALRHTFIQDIYYELRKTHTKAESEFILMTITRHKTVDALRKYIRDYSLELAEDWSDKYTIEY